LTFTNNNSVLAKHVAVVRAVILLKIRLSLADFYLVPANVIVLLFKLLIMTSLQFCCDSVIGSSV